MLTLFFERANQTLPPLKFLIVMLLLHSSDSLVIIFCAPLSFAMFFLKQDVMFQCWLNQHYMEMKTTLLLLLTATYMVHDLICPSYYGFALKVCAPLLSLCGIYNFHRSISLQVISLGRGCDLHSLYLYDFSCMKTCFVQKKLVYSVL